MNNDETKCLEKIMRFLMVRECSEKMLYDKYIKKYPKKALENVLVFCKEQNYLNDKRFAESYIRTTLKMKNIGFYKIFSYLKARGISSDLFKDIWDSMNIDEYSFLELALKKKLKTLKYKDSFEKKYKLQNFLLSRGFRKESLNKVDFANIISLNMI